MFVEWEKQIHPDSELIEMNQKYSVEVKVHSVQSLFDYFNNPNNSYYESPDEGLPFQTKHDYSRSGVYSFPAIFNASSYPTFSFHLFLEGG
jgi:hypothetical protein